MKTSDLSRYAAAVAAFLVAAAVSFASDGTDRTPEIHGTVRGKYEKLIAEGVTPIRRFGRPQDVADCVSVLASGKLDFSTGQAVNADGGFHIRRL